MSTSNTLQIKNLQPDSPLSSPPRAVPVGATNMAIEFDGSTMLDPAMQVYTEVEYSPDGGTTWRMECAANFQCGSKERDGVTPRAVYRVSCDIPTDGTNRMLRGTLTVTGGVLTTTLTLITTP